MATPRPITDSDRDEVRRLHAAGHGRNEIARAIKRSAATVSKIAAGLGLSFDRAAEVATATAVRSADLAARRVHLAETLHTDAERLRAQLWAPCITGAFGGKDNVWSEQPLARPLFADQRQIMSAVSIAVDKSLKLVPPREDAAAESRSVIGDLMAGLARDYAERHGGPPPELAAPTDDSE